MNEITANVLLASTSPRRRELLQQVGFQVETCVVDIDESSITHESPTELVRRLALAKVNDCVHRFDNHPDWPIIAADTVIDLDGTIVGKPKDRQDAIHTLLSLADRSHTVRTGVCVSRREQGQEVVVVSTEVSFGPISETQAEAYWSTGEPCDKAGSYAIQGIGARFVSHISGSYSNVVGLPLFETIRLLQGS